MMKGRDIIETEKRMKEGFGRRIVLEYLTNPIWVESNPSMSFIIFVVITVPKEENSSLRSSKY